jgi:hypothetical protein
MPKIIIAALVLLTLWLWTFLPPDVKKAPEIIREYKAYKTIGH